MAKAKFEGRWVELCDDWRGREQVEAEKALGIDFMEGTRFEQMLTILYMSVRQSEESLDPDRRTPTSVLADQVLNVRFSEFAEMEPDEEADASSPPDEGGVSAESPATSEPQTPPTAGSLRSVESA
jgi:hypothetical protein